MLLLLPVNLSVIDGIRYHPYLPIDFCFPLTTGFLFVVHSHWYAPISVCDHRSDPLVICNFQTTPFSPMTTLLVGCSWHICVLAYITDWFLFSFVTQPLAFIFARHMLSLAFTSWSYTQPDNSYNNRSSISATSGNATVRVCGQHWLLILRVCFWCILVRNFGIKLGIWHWTSIWPSENWKKVFFWNVRDTANTQLFVKIERWV